MKANSVLPKMIFKDKHKFMTSEPQNNYENEIFIKTQNRNYDNFKQIVSFFNEEDEIQGQQGPITEKNSHNITYYNKYHHNSIKDTYYRNKEKVNDLTTRSHNLSLTRKECKPIGEILINAKENYENFDNDSKGKFRDLSERLRKKEKTPSPEHYYRKSSSKK